MKSYEKTNLLQNISLVVGNMIGSGIFLLPASLAVYGYISTFGWLFSCLGAVLLAIIFGHLSIRLPNAAGGPYEYAKHEFGRFPAFIVAWSYWTSIWFANGAIAVALVGYLKVIIPALGNDPLTNVAACWFFIWLFTWVNTKSLLFVSNIQLLTTLVKIIPLILVGFVGVFYIDFSLIRISEISFSKLTATTTLTFFAFLGLETAAIAGDQAKSASFVRKATILGTIITSVIYILSSFVVLSLLNHDVLSQSSSPFADAASLFLGPVSYYVVAIGAIFSTMGALNGWILVQGHIPMAAAKDQLFPEVFGKLNDKGSPEKGIIITSLITTMIVLLNYSKGLVALFTMLISLSTLSVMVPYFFSVAAYLSSLNALQNPQNLHKIGLPLIVLLFLLWVVYGCGWDIMLYGLSFQIFGIVFYFLVKFNNQKRV